MLCPPPVPGALAWLQTFSVTADTMVSSLVRMPLHIFTWKMLAVVNGPGLARPREESGTKLTRPSIAGWEVCREVCGCRSSLFLFSHTWCLWDGGGERPSVLKRMLWDRRGHVWDDGAEVESAKAGGHAEARGRSGWVPGVVTAQRLGCREKVLVTPSSHSDLY